MPRKLKERVYMTAETFERDLAAIYGPTWEADFAIYAGLSRSQVNRYANGIINIPKPVALLVKSIRDLTNNAISLPELYTVPLGRARTSARNARARRVLRRAAS